MKILLFGASGQVGHALRRSLTPLGDIVCTTRNGVLADGTPCEIADFDEPRSLPSLMARIAPDIVVNAAAYTAVDRAEDEPAVAFRVNGQAPGVIADVCAQRDVLLVHYSTDYVFDGTATRPYREGDSTAPRSIYGASKLAGEQAIQATGARHMIFRTAWVYAAQGNNFLLTMLRLAKERDELRVVADQVGTPTSAELIANVTAAILSRPFVASGLWHLTAAGQATWHGFAQEIIERACALGLLAHRPAVIPIATSEFPTRATRPGYSCLDIRRLEQTFDIQLPDWTQAMDGVLARLPH